MVGRRSDCITVLGQAAATLLPLRKWFEVF